MNILYIAISCDPYNGSEDQIGWSIPWECSIEENVYVITRKDLMGSIQTYIRDNEKRNLHITYVEMPKLCELMCKGPLYSGRLFVWNRKVFSIAKAMCKKYHIDIVHQITPIEFRNVGNFGKISSIKFVCGPIGGAELIPAGLKEYAKANFLVEMLRSFMNKMSKKYMNVTGILTSCDYILFANQETKEYMKDIIPDKSVGNVYSEIGINGLHDKARAVENKKSITFLVAGRLIYRKGIRFLLDAVERCDPCSLFHVVIAGSGPEISMIKKVIKEKGLQHRIILLGNVPFSKMEEVYSNSDVLILPSIRETTGSVILEAMSRGIPVITINRFGGSLIVENGYNGWLYQGESKEDYVKNLAQIIEKCALLYAADDNEMIRIRQNAVKTAECYTWKQKVLFYKEIYKELLGTK